MLCAIRNLVGCVGDGRFVLGENASDNCGMRRVPGEVRPKPIEAIVRAVE